MNKFKIASFNIFKDDGEFPSRIYDLKDKIKSKNLDIICFQEDFNSLKFSSSKLLNKELNYNYLSTKTRNKIRKKGKSSSNLTILSRFKIKLLDEIFFQKGKEEERACQIIEVNLKKSKLLLINTHLCHLSSEIRSAQIQTILKRVGKYKGYELILFCGDLNATPNIQEIALIKQNGFKDKNIQYSHENGVIIDYIFYKSKKNIEVKSKIALKDFSDHYCLINSFKF